MGSSWEYFYFCVPVFGKKSSRLPFLTLIRFWYFALQSNHDLEKRNSFNNGSNIPWLGMTRPVGHWKWKLPRRHEVGAACGWRGVCFTSVRTRVNIFPVLVEPVWLLHQRKEDAAWGVEHTKNSRENKRTFAVPLRENAGRGQRELVKLDHQDGPLWT